jgi:hypothetical protein
MPMSPALPEKIRDIDKQVAKIRDEVLQNSDRPVAETPPRPHKSTQEH